jgi:hypothetical protein
MTGVFLNPPGHVVLSHELSFGAVAQKFAKILCN